MGDNSKYHHSTINELAFIKGLGTWRQIGQPMPRKKLLEKYYFEGIPAKGIWKKIHAPGVVVSIDRKKIVSHVAQELLKG